MEALQLFRIIIVVLPFDYIFHLLKQRSCCVGGSQHLFDATTETCGAGLEVVESVINKFASYGGQDAVG
jgi:hypothetical protein